MKEFEEPGFEVCGENLWIVNDDGALEWVTVLINGTPKWKKIIQNNVGAYVLTPKKRRYYLLINNH